MYFVLAAAILGAVPAPPPALVRLAVIDNSGSMSGERITAVREELRTIINQLPPSPSFPLLLIVFHGTVESTKIFTDARAAEKALGSLDGSGGGTRIAPALLRARDEVRGYQDAGHLLILLFTDGEDPDAHGIRRAETELDQLFGDRGKRGLSQTVFVKRWANANADLVSRIRSRGHAEVLDAGTLQIASVTIIPTIAVGEVRRDPTNAQQLRIAFRPSLVCRGLRSGVPAPPCDFICKNPGATGDTLVRYRASPATALATITVPIPPTAEHTKSLTISFAVAPVKMSASASSFVLPILTASTVDVPVPLPPLSVYHRIAAEIRPTKRPEWDDPLAPCAHCEVDLEITVTAVDKSTQFDRATTFRITAQTGSRLIAGTDTVSVPGPGIYHVPLTIEIAHPTQSAAAKIGEISLEVVPIKKASYLAYLPPTLTVKRSGLPAPKPVRTTLSANVKRLTPPRWIELTEQLAEFDAEVAFHVAGPIPPKTTLTLICPSNVRNSVLPPRTNLSSGTSTVLLHVVARLRPSKGQSLKFSILPPPNLPSVTFHVDQGFSLTIVGPPPVQIKNAGDSGAASHVQVVIPDNQKTANIRLSPILADVDPAKLIRLPAIQVRPADTNNTLQTGVALPAFRPQTAILPLPKNDISSFFLDMDHSIDVRLEPQHPSPALVPAQVQIVIHRLAPFKRLLRHLSWALFAFGAIFLTALIVRRLREPLAVPMEASRA